MWLRGLLAKSSLIAQNPLNQSFTKELSSLGDHLRAWRLKNELSQPQVANMIKVTANTVADWELNRHAISRPFWPTIETLIGHLPDYCRLTKLSRPILMYRYTHNISIKKLAQMLKVDAATLQNVETGETSFQKPTLQRLKSLFV